MAARAALILSLAGCGPQIEDLHPVWVEAQEQGRGEEVLIEHFGLQVEEPQLREDALYTFNT